MNEPTTDEKIQQLVRAVLEAVDSRLDGVRHELAVFAGDVERRHHDVLDVIAAIEQRVQLLEHAQHQTVAATAAAVADRLAQVQTRLDRLETDAHAAVSAAADLSQISKPLYAGGHITTQLPVVTDPAIHEITSLAIPPAVQPTMTVAAPAPQAPVPAPAPPAPAAAAEAEDEIDLEQLTNLLNERLGHLNLPTRPDAPGDQPAG